MIHVALGLLVGMLKLAVAGVALFTPTHANPANGGRYSMVLDTLPLPSVDAPVHQLVNALIVATNGWLQNFDPRLGEVHLDQTRKRMRFIPPGRFLMGSTKGDADEKPLHWVAITRPFWMDETEVTADEYQKCVDAGQCRWQYKNHWVWPKTPYSKADIRELRWKYCTGYRSHRRAGYPVNCINWFRADHFCRVWRKGRLPREAEWEWAARGGLHHKTYSWGDAEIEGRGVLDRRIGPEPVGQYPPNGFGLYDMTGNVWEWVNDWYSSVYYRTSPLHDPQGVCPGRSHCGLPDRAMRGGSWFEDGSGLRVAYRNHHAPHFTYRVVGFRCAADLSIPRHTASTKGPGPSLWGRAWF